MAPAGRGGGDDGRRLVAEGAAAATAPARLFSSKMTTYLVVSIVINLGLAGASYIAGNVLRRWLGD